MLLYTQITYLYKYIQTKYQTMINKYPTSTTPPTKPPPKLITTQTYQNVMAIKLLHKTYKSIIYQCQFIATQQKTTIKLINMQHIHMIYNPKLLGEEICVRPDYQCVGFFDRTDGEEMLRRFLFQVSLMRLQEDADVVDRRDVRESRKYLYGADGVLYSNFIIYSKPMERQFQPILQRQKRGLSQLQKVKLRNQLGNLHFQQLTYKNLSSTSIVFIPDSESMSKRKITSEQLADYQMIFTPVLKIGANVQPISTITKDSSKIDAVFQNQLEQLEQIMQSKVFTNNNQCESINIQVPLQHSKQKKKNNSNISMHLHYLANKLPIKQSSISYAAFVSLQKILEIPKIYILIQQTPTIQKFQQQLLKLKKTKPTQTELQWYMSKYLQITYINNNGNITPHAPPANRNNTASGISMRNIDYHQNTMSKSLNNTNNMKNFLTVTSFGNTNTSDNYQLQMLAKEFKNLNEDRYRPTSDHEGMLGWGDLNVRYHYSTNNSTYPAYIQSLQKYLKQLHKYINYKKCRKIYHFYSAKLLQTQYKYNQAILHLKQSLKIITETKPQKITQNYYNCEKNVKSQMAVVCHELGRLYVEIKRYKEALGWYDQCLKVKEEVYGRCSIEMLATLYNIIYVLLNYQIDKPQQTITLDSKPSQAQDASNKLPHLLPYYLHLLSQTKQRIPNQQALTEWADSLTIRQQLSINIITKIEHELTDLYHDPWRDQLMRLFASKVGKTRSNGKSMLGGSSQVQVMRKVEDISVHREVSHRNQQQIVCWACNQVLAIQNTHYKTSTANHTNEQRCATTLKTINKYISIPLQPQTFYILYTLKQYLILISTQLSQYTHQQQVNTNTNTITNTNTNSTNWISILFECINNLKKLYKYLNQFKSRNNSQVQQIRQGIVEFLYSLYRLVKKYQCSSIMSMKQQCVGQQLQIDWQWILYEYYSYGTPQNNPTNKQTKTRRQHSINNTLEYCLLLHKLYKDYGRIYNSLIHAKSIIINKTNNLSSIPTTSYIIYHYLVAICLIHMRRYQEAVVAINNVLQPKSSTNSSNNNDNSKNINNSSNNSNIDNNQQDELVQLYQLLPKKMIYRYQFAYMLLHCYYKMRNYHQFINIFQKQQASITNPHTSLYNNNKTKQTNNSIAHILQQQNKCIISMAITVYQHLSTQDPNQSTTSMHLLSNLQTNCQYPCKLILKILINSPNQLLRYISNILQNYSLTTNHHRIQISTKQSTSSQCNIILDILEQNNKQQLTDILVFYQEVLNVLINVYRSSQDRRGEVCGIMEYLLGDVFGYFCCGKDGQQIDQKHILPLQLSTILSNQLSTGTDSDSESDGQQTNKYYILFSTIILTYFPVIVQTLQHYHTQAQHQQQHNHQHQHHHGHKHHKSTHNSVSIFNHRYKIQILQILQVLLFWFRRNRMYEEVVFCRIFLQACGRTTSHQEALQVGWSQQIQQVCLILGLSTIIHDENSNSKQKQQITSQQQYKIDLPTIFHKFHLQKYLTGLIHNMQLVLQQCEQYKQSYRIFYDSQNNQTPAHHTNMDEHMECIENLLLLLDGLKLNLGNLLPGAYMDEICQGILAQIKQNIEIS